MLYIENDGTIRLTRGDTAYFGVSIIDSSTGTEYEPSDDDVILFTIKKSVNASDSLIQKKFGEVNNNLFKLLPEDTSDLRYGRYQYDVQLTRGNGDVYTVIPPTVFEVMKEVTW